ncbi:Abi family protein [Algibacillus agarilyticus]|uniref:Abi family protein n=1 Tax=Algibacillus agarilyticus TaxID=2234133 RepID=UPI000DCFE9CE
MYLVNQRDNVSNLFEVNSDFNQVIFLYEWDRQLRSLILDAIERTEIAVKTQLTYHGGHSFQTSFKCAYSVLLELKRAPLFFHFSAFKRSLSGHLLLLIDIIRHYKSNILDFQAYLSGCLLR